MPVELRSLESGSRHLRDSGDTLWWLGDVIPLREFKLVLSFGDLILLLGLAVVAANLTLRKARAPRVLSTNANAGLVSIASTEIPVDDDQVIGLSLVAEAATHGYASRDDSRGFEAALQLPDGTRRSVEIDLRSNRGHASRNKGNNPAKGRGSKAGVSSKPRPLVEARELAGRKADRRNPQLTSPVPPSDYERQAGPALGDSAEARTRERLPVFREP